MFYFLGVEEIEPYHWVAHTFELPGCFSRGATQEEAIKNAPGQVSARLEWLARHGRPFSSDDGEIKIKVSEVFESWESTNDYRVNAFFEHDKGPLTADDVDLAGWLLGQSRQELLGICEPIPVEKLNQPDEKAAKGSIAKTLAHIATAEWWYFDSLDLAFERRTEDIPLDPFENLKTVRGHVMEQLPKLVGDTQVVDRSGELWSARKILRRTLWHEGDHIAQIKSLIQAR